jgi:DNA-binding Lrp family transcriptional regulator
LLCENARISLVDIGQKLKEHPKTIAYRISRLEKIKLIEAYRISIDHTKLGYTYYKIFLNISNYHNEEIKRLKEFIKRNPATIYIVEGIGLHADLDFEMMIKDNKELFDFIKELRKEFPKIIENYNTVIFMETLKVRYLPF